MAPLEPLAGTAELAPDHHQHHQPPRQRSLSISSHHAQTQLSSSIASLRSAGATPSASQHTGIHALKAKLGLGGVARRTLGISLLLLTVFLWTLSNFLASSIFSDHTFDKPFFVVYINTSIFAISLVPMFVRFVSKHGIEGLGSEVRALLRNSKGTAAAAAAAAAGGRRRERSSSLLGRGRKTREDEQHGLLGADAEDDDDLLDDDLLDDDVEEGEASSSSTFEIVDAPEEGGEKLSLRETAVLSLEFCMLWFCANYFASACLEYTSVGSVTILTSTSSVWTLIFCAVMRVETFSYRKLVGVLASLAGVVLISTVDLSGQSDEDRGSFPHKSQASIAIGDGMAFFSSIVYGLYVTVMKRRVGDEDRVNMPLFFGLVGVLNLLFLWPGFFLLHWTGIEPFEWPPTGRVWAIIVVSSALSTCTKQMFANRACSSTQYPPSSATCPGRMQCSSRHRSSSRSASR